ncbi:MAG: preprotein translocase subunit YajC [Myxococcales bacterium]|nr:preprotein translocase subunit YajC [Myxococcales bacterium]
MNAKLSLYDVYQLAQQRTNTTTTEKTDTKTTTEKKDDGKKPPAASGNIWTTFLFFGAMILIFYFLLIRPQKKKQQQHETFISGLKKGDNVVTNSGIFGRIAGVDGDTVTVEIAQGVRVKMVKSQVASLQGGAVPAAESNKSVQRKVA